MILSWLFSTMGRSLVRNDYLHCNIKWYVDLAFPTLLSTISNVMRNQKEFEEIRSPRVLIWYLLLPKHGSSFMSLKERLDRYLQTRKWPSMI